MSPTTKRHRVEATPEARDFSNKEEVVVPTFEFSIFDHFSGAHYCEVRGNRMILHMFIFTYFYAITM